MTIRRILLAAFLAVGLLPAIVLVGLSSLRTQAAMRSEIEQSLSAQAAVAASDLDKQLFERLQNGVTWSHLEVMQDLHVGDVDKRLSAFLSNMRERYGGVYTALYAVDMQGRIVASSQAEAIGRSFTNGMTWQRAELSGDRVIVEAPRRNVNGNEILVLRLPIDSQFTEGSLGQLVLVVDWSLAEHELDAGTHESRSVAVIDDSGRIVAVSRNLRSRVVPGATRVDPARWVSQHGQMARERNGAPLVDGQVIVSAMRSPGRGTFAGFGWTTLVLESSDAALAPVRRMTITSLGLLLLAAAATVFLAYSVSGRIARPIVALTDYVIGFMREQRSPPPPPASGEVGELMQAFTRMVDDLEASRQTLVRASQLAAIGEFAAMMAHEIRTPLGILRSSAQMLMSDQGLGGESRELIGFIDTETQRLNRLVTELLERARVRTPRRLPEDLDALISHCLAMLSSQALRQGVTLEHVPAIDPVAYVDAEQMTQVLLNLLLNALQIMQAGGHVRVTLSGDSDVVVLQLDDNGTGIAPGERQRIFEPFVYRREGGLGLGLAVVKQIVVAHGGDITVGTSDLGGARFRIRLPRQVPAA